jgi:uncharacterized protein (TIGR00369 family)
MNGDDSFTAQPSSRMCFVCGVESPVGLKLRFEDNGKDEVQAHYTVRAEYQGYPGVVHGGIVAAMLDEAAGRTAMIGNHETLMVTAKITIKYRQPTPTETPLLVVGKILKRRGKLLVAASEVRLPDGSISAEAETTMVALPEEQIEEMTRELGDWRVWPS